MERTSSYTRSAPLLILVANLDFHKSHKSSKNPTKIGSLEDIFSELAHRLLGPRMQAIPSQHLSRPSRPRPGT